jgi:molecular chaperone HscB
MNYFELFEIPVQFRVDITSLHKKFFELSRKYHPDYFINDKSDIQEEALQKSAELNRAFNAFKNPDETIKYVLQQKGLIEEEEKYQLPPDFLMEMMEINEQLMDQDQLAIGSRQSVMGSLQLAVDNLQKEIYEPVKEIVEHYQEGVNSEKELLQVKEYYYKKKYLDRIRWQLAGKA